MGSRRQTWAEIALIFVVFFIQGAAPVPEVNEPNYLGKAIHFWNPNWVRGDFFLDSADAHQTFYFTFGWLSLFLTPTVLAWTGRVLTWGVLAWAWQRLSAAVAPRAWFSVLTAAIFAFLAANYHLAGEWIIGGVEAKGFAFVLMLLGLEALWRNRWNRAWLCFGAAAGFHVLIGGWAVIAAGATWLAIRLFAAHGDPDKAPALRTMLGGLLGGLLLSLPGAIPSLWLTWGVDGAIVRQANQIYVYHRLYHHLDPFSIPIAFVSRFAAMCVCFGLLCLLNPRTDATRRLRWFAAATLGLSLVGVGAAYLAWLDRGCSASLLKFYWFRLADITIPLAVSLEVAVLITDRLKREPALGRQLLAIAILASGVPLAFLTGQRLQPQIPPADLAMPRFVEWRDACWWIANSEEIPADARFLTERLSSTFKWYARRSEVANWKEIPQDAAAIVEWWRRMRDLYGLDPAETGQSWCKSLAEQDPERLARLGVKYKAGYLLTFHTPELPFEVVYQNHNYRVYKLPQGGIIPPRSSDSLEQHP